MSSRSLDNPVKEYDVFLNFRGMDTRNGFTSHLHSALEQQKYKVFIDDEKLERGSSIKESLLEAIENSSSSIPIISENYASSTACLRELAKIVECKKTWGQTVIPVFYHVNPSLLKNLRIQSYMEEFAKYWINPKYEPEEVQSWKDALAEVCGLAGWTIYEFRDNEAKMIKKIVADLQKRLHILNQSSNEGPSTQSTLPDMADVDRSLQSMKLNKVTLLSGDLRSLIILYQSSRNISDEAFPDQFDSFVSLQLLNLGDNPFIALPQSIKALSKLKFLLLEHCDRLKSLGPEHPSSLSFVNIYDIEIDCGSNSKSKTPLSPCYNPGKTSSPSSYKSPVPQNQMGVNRPSPSTKDNKAAKSKVSVPSKQLNDHLTYEDEDEDEDKDEDKDDYSYNDYY